MGVREDVGEQRASAAEAVKARLANCPHCGAPTPNGYLAHAEQVDYHRPQLQPHGIVVLASPGEAAEVTRGSDVSDEEAAEFVLECANFSNPKTRQWATAAARKWVRRLPAGRLHIDRHQQRTRSVAVSPGTPGRERQPRSPARRTPARARAPDEPHERRPGNRANVVGSADEIRILLATEAGCRGLLSVTCSYCYETRRGTRRILLGDEQQPGWWAEHAWTCSGTAVAA